MKTIVLKNKELIALILSFILVFIFTIITFNSYGSPRFYSKYSIKFKYLLTEQSKNAITQYCHSNDFKNSVDKEIKNNDSFEPQHPADYENFSYTWGTENDIFSIFTVKYLDDKKDNLSIFCKSNGSILVKQLSKFNIESKDIVYFLDDIPIYNNFDTKHDNYLIAAVAVSFIPLLACIVYDITMDIVKLVKNRRQRKQC